MRLLFSLDLHRSSPIKLFQLIHQRLSHVGICNELLPMGAALACKKSAKRPKTVQNSLRWPILPDPIGLLVRLGFVSADCLSGGSRRNSYQEDLSTMGDGKASYLLLHFNPVYLPFKAAILLLLLKWQNNYSI